LLAALRHPWQRRHVEVLHGVDLAVPRGTVTGLLGPNGAGKTTLLRIMAASILPDRGQVRILGREVQRAPARARRDIGFVLAEERSFFWRLSARQNLRFFATLCDMTRHEADRRIEQLATLLEITGELEKPFRDMSTGMRQRLSLARALLHDPQILLVDEPTRALDPGAARRTRTLIDETLVAQLGKTVLLATHSLEEARQLCRQVALLSDGRVTIHGPVERVLEQVADVFEVES